NGHSGDRVVVQGSQPLGQSEAGARIRLPSGVCPGGIGSCVPYIKSIASQGAGIRTSIVLPSAPSAATANAAGPDGRSRGSRITASVGDIARIFARTPSTATKLLGVTLKFSPAIRAVPATRSTVTARIAGAL